MTDEGRNRLTFPYYLDAKYRQTISLTLWSRTGYFDIVGQGGNRPFDIVGCGDDRPFDIVVLGGDRPVDIVGWVGIDHLILWSKVDRPFDIVGRGWDRLYDMLDGGGDRPFNFVGWGGGGGSTLVKYCWVCVAWPLRTPNPYSLICGQL